MDQSNFHVSLILSANRALQGAVTRNLRSVTIGFGENICTMRCYFDSGVTEDEKEILDSAFAEIIADFPQIDNWKFEALEKPFPEKVDVLDILVFSRHEPGDNSA